MKNPFLSLWLSQANAWSGAMRGLWAAEVRRQQTQLMNQWIEQSVRFWSGAWMLPPVGQGRRDRRRPDGR